MKLVPSRIELLILALLAPRLNQLGQGTGIRVFVLYTSLRSIKKPSVARFTDFRRNPSPWCIKYVDTTVNDLLRTDSPKQYTLPPNFQREGEERKEGEGEDFRKNNNNINSYGS